MIYFVSAYEDYLHVHDIKFIKPEQVVLNGTILCEDTETTGLDYHAKDPLLLIQIGDEENQYVYDVKSGVDLTYIKEVLEDRKRIKVLANGIFERNMLRSVGIQINSMWDILLAAKVLRQGREDRFVWVGESKHYIYSLAGVYKEYLDKHINKEQQASFIGHIGKYYEADQIRYAAEDVKLYDIYGELMRRLVDYNLITSDYTLHEKVEELVDTDRYRKAVLEFKVQEYFADMLYNGIHLHKGRWRDLYESNIRRKRETEIALNKELPNIDPSKKGWRIEPPSVVTTVQGSLFGDSDINAVQAKARHQMNWGSSMQIYPLIKQVIGRDVTDKHGKKTISNKELKKLPEKDNPFISNLLQYSELNKRINAYGIKYFENIHPSTGRIHFDINQLLETGRIAPRKPNLAQIPSTEEWRNCFTPEKGFDIVGADYSAQESRVMADKSGDDAFIDFFLNGDGDSHSMVATRVYTAKEGREIKVTKKVLKVAHKGELDDSLKSKFNALFPKANIIKIEGEYIVYSNTDGAECPLRQKGKTLNFFISFGGSAYTLSIDSAIPYEEAEALINGFWKGFPQLKEYFDREKRFALENGYVVINHVTKGRRWFPDWKEYRGYEKRKEEKLKEFIKQYGERIGKNMFYKGLKEKTLGLAEAGGRANKIRGDIERGAMNTGIQGTAADMTKTACILIAERLEEEKLSSIKDVKPINYIHDEILLETYEELSPRVSNMLKECMEKASTIFMTRIMIPAAPFIAKVWKH